MWKNKSKNFITKIHNKKIRFYKFGWWNWKNSLIKRWFKWKNDKDLINVILKEYKIIYPGIEKFEEKIKITKGECLLSTEFDFLIETLEFFGLPHGYMEKKDHWLDWLEKEAKKRNKKNDSEKNYVLF